MAPHERARARPSVDCSPSGSDGSSETCALDVTSRAGGKATLTLTLHADERFTLSLAAEGEPLRLALDWDRRSEEHFVGLGARHGTEFDQRGRAVQLGADRRYTGPDCPPEMLAEGGIPQGDCAPMPWMLSSRGYGVLALTDANGTRFDMSSDRTSVSTRALAGPLRLELHAPADPGSAAAGALPADRASRCCCRSGATGSGRAATCTRTARRCSTTSTASGATRSRSTRS